MYHSFLSSRICSSYNIFSHSGYNTSTDASRSTRKAFCWDVVWSCRLSLLIVLMILYVFSGLFVAIKGKVGVSCFNDWRNLVEPAVQKFFNVLSQLIHLQLYPWEILSTLSLTGSFGLLNSSDSLLVSCKVVIDYHCRKLFQLLSSVSPHTLSCISLCSSSRHFGSLQYFTLDLTFRFFFYCHLQLSSFFFYHIP